MDEPDFEKPLDLFSASTKPGERITDKPELPAKGIIMRLRAHAETVEGEAHLKVGTSKGRTVYSDEPPQIGGTDKYPPLVPFRSDVSNCDRGQEVTTTRRASHEGPRPIGWQPKRCGHRLPIELHELARRRRPWSRAHAHLDRSGVAHGPRQRRQGVGSRSSLSKVLASGDRFGPQG